MCARLKEELPCIFDKEDAKGMSHYLKAEFNRFMNATKYPKGSQGRSTYLGSTKMTDGQGNGEIPFCRKAAAPAVTTAAAPGPMDKKAKARATLKGKRDALKGAFNKFKAKGCGKGAAAKGSEAAGRSRRAAHGAANMTCAELMAGFNANKLATKAAYAKLKAARSTCKKVNATRFARAAHAVDDDAAIAALSCTELEDEITTLKTAASAVGQSLEASTGKTTAAPGPMNKKAKARATLKGKRDALKGVFDKFKAKGCGKGAAAKGSEAAGRSRRAAHGAANMTCAELTTAFNANKLAAKAVYAKLKAARSTCKKVNATRFARASHAVDDDAAIAALSCTELEDEIKTLKTQASAAGLSLEASTSDDGATTAMATTAPGGDESGAAAAAAGVVSAFVAVAFAQLA